MVGLEWTQMNGINFKNWLLSENNVYRYVHKDGRGLMNNQSLNYNKLNDDEQLEIEDEYLGLQQPPSNLHNQKVIFVFTDEGENRHRKLIELLTKASKRGVLRNVISLNDYEIVWNSGDGQLGLKKKPI